MSKKNPTEPQSTERSFSQVLRAHNFTLGHHPMYAWMQMWNRGKFQFCEVDPPIKGSKSHGNARLVAAGIGEHKFTSPEDLDKILSS